jgi:hypothetical protein
VPHSGRPTTTPDSLPPDLLALERELTNRPEPGPPGELRARVLDAVSRERPTPRPESVRGGFARFAAATAAAALLAINLSASVANDTDWHLRPAGPASADDIDRIRELVPDLPEREVRRQALLLRSAAGLTAAPRPAGALILRNRTPDRWDTP